METCSPASQFRAERVQVTLKADSERGENQAWVCNLDGRKLCFNQLGVPTGPGRERVQERNREGQVGHLGHSQLIK